MIKRFCQILFILLSTFALQNAVAQTQPEQLAPDTTANKLTVETITINATTDTVAKVKMEETWQAPKFTYGIRGGANFATLRYNEGNLQFRQELDTDRRNHVRPQAGLVLNMALNNALSIQPELLFNQKGIKNMGVTSFSGNLTVIETYKRQLILNYIELPVLFKVMSPVNGDSLKFFVNVGPAISFLLNGNDKLKTATIDTKEAIEFSGPAEFKRLEASVHAGAGFELLTKMGNLAVEGRFIYGLTNVIAFNDLAAADQPKAYNRSVGLYLTYYLPAFGK